MSIETRPDGTRVETDRVVTHPDPATGTAHVADRPARTESSGLGRALLIALAIVIVLAVIAFATGMISMQTSGELSAPNVEVTGGQVPNVRVDTANVNVGTEQVVVDVPAVSIEKAGE